ncbi:MAG: dienelactone hydrolase family protein [Rhodospirillales bacterium]|nr:dienelactone hydrolase family protein [Rhodospirillales bacterium]
MPSFLALLAFLAGAGVAAERVRIPGADGVELDAALVRPVGPATGSAVVALHGCGGPYPSRDGSWAVALARAGHPVLLPDSFGSRGLGSQCRVRHRRVTPSGLRRQDAIAAGRWLLAQPDLARNGIALIGWSNGGGTVLATANAAADPPPGLFRRFVAFYPGCATRSRDPSWSPTAPVLILVGAADDWTPAPPCQTLAARYPDRVTLAVYPDAYHDFDAPDARVRVLHGLATPPGGSGEAHAGTNPAARADALRRVPAFLAATP